MSRGTLARGARPIGDFAGHFRPAGLVVTALALLVGLAACAPGATKDGPRLSFEERAHDFGQLSASRPAEYRFAFKNTGNRPLEITDIRPEPASPGG